MTPQRPLDPNPGPDPDSASSPSRSPSFADWAALRTSRRGLLRAGAAGMAAGVVGSRAVAASESRPTTLDFESIENVISADHGLAEGYSADVLIRWGDPILAGAPPFNPRDLDASPRAQQFGFNNDFLAFMPLPRGSETSDRGLLWVNHEYPHTALMFPGEFVEDEGTFAARTRVEMASVGGSVIEVKRDGQGHWGVVRESAYNRRITANTSLELRGPAAGDRRLMTSADPSGRFVLGTLGNCAGGKTPWGTVLSAEENVDQYFTPDAAPLVENGGEREVENHTRFGVGKYHPSKWGRVFDRFDVHKEPRELNRFGWVVEIDPYDPASTPKKRTALGRIKHESATVCMNHDGRVVVYSGDDQRFEHLYRFVSDGRYIEGNHENNEDLLDAGTLYVARFDDEGITWIPLVFGTGALVPRNGFESQADVLIETRKAASLSGATPMDRPEDLEQSPTSGHVFLALTNNTKRTDAQRDVVNSRAGNRYGQIVELIPPVASVHRDVRKPGREHLDHAALHFRWDFLLLGGNSSVPSHGARYHSEVGENDWFACPDNLCFDPKGRAWISTDQGDMQFTHGIPDGIRACDVEGSGRALTRLFFTCPRGAEATGPEMTPDGKTLFVAVQHPGDEPVDPQDSSKGRYAFDNPRTRWPAAPDSEDPPRPSIVVITADNGGPIGG